MPSPDYSHFPITLYNSLTRQKERFEALAPPRVGMYVCGPTMYDHPHLGHARAAITYDVVFRYMQQLGYRVRYVRNITDVGHLEDEIDNTGEDRITKKARLEQLEPMEVVQMYSYRYRQALHQLNTLPPSIEPLASGHIIEQIKVIEDIIENGYAYEANGSVYFDLEKYAQEEPYGQLSGKVLDDLRTGNRATEGLDEKRSPHDFALWKRATPSHIMRWPSPWGEGFPGWHIECTSMSTKYLGETFDIHGGGLDLQFPHHEAEIAQNYGAFHRPPARYWMHNNLITIDGQKMSKSLGNFITLEQLFAGDHPALEQAYSPMTVRFFILQAHYRSPLDFSNEALQAAEKGVQRLMNILELLGQLTHTPADVNEELNRTIQQLCEECYQQMSDDFNTARAIAALFELGSKINAFYHQQLPLGSIGADTFEQMQATYRLFVTDVLGLQAEATAEDTQQDALVQMLIEMRKEARQNKDYALSDQIRDRLKAIGIQLKDEPSGKTSYTVIGA